MERGMRRRAGTRPPCLRDTHIDALPGVSILKPLCGADPDLAENLRSFFRQDYPDFELVFAIEDANDPAIPVVKALLKEFPEVPALLVVDPRAIGANPKVNNLANASRFARHDLVLISDSNVRVEPSYTAEMVACMSGPEIGLVTSPIVAKGAGNFATQLEAFQLHTFVIGGMCAANMVVETPLVMGKSMLLRRSDLEYIGGWSYLASYIAEDQVCGEAMHEVGKRVVMNITPITNVLGHLSLRKMFSRQLRWSTLRRKLHPLLFVAEPLQYVTTIALLWAILAPGLWSLIALAIVLPLKAMLDQRLESSLDQHRGFWQTLRSSVARDLVMTLVWICAWGYRTIHWRGRGWRIGKRTQAVAHGNQATSTGIERSPRVYQTPAFHIPTASEALRLRAWQQRESRQATVLPVQLAVLASRKRMLRRARNAPVNQWPEPSRHDLPLAVGDTRHA